MKQLRVHGRGGQGSVVASKLLAVALFREGYDVQAFPAFGVERRGAPVTAFLRYSDEPIRIRCEIYEPDDLIVLDPTLVEAVDVTEGLAEGRPILINSERPPSAFAELLAGYEVATVDASGIASRLGLGTPAQPIVNTAILGAYASHSGQLPLGAACRAIAEEVPTKVEENVEAAEEAARAVTSERAEEAQRV